MACALGMGLLLIPMFVNKSPFIDGLVTVLRPAGWIALAFGGMLLGLHHFAKTPQAESEERHYGSKSITDISTRRNRKVQTAVTAPLKSNWGRPQLIGLYPS